MSLLPAPRNIRRNWKPEPMTIERAVAEISRCLSVPERYGKPVEARAWVMARGWRRGQLKRIDVAYEAKECFASKRLSGQFYTLRLGARAAV